MREMCRRDRREPAHNSFLDYPIGRMIHVPVCLGMAHRGAALSFPGSQGCMPVLRRDAYGFEMCIRDRIPGVQKGFTPSKARQNVSALQNIFKPGDRVMHRKFGEGNVVALKGSGADTRISIEFTAYGVKEFSLSIAPIVKIEEE